MSSPQQAQASGVELKVVGRVLNTVGVVFLSICVALAGALYEEIGAVQRTGIGIAIAALMILAGEVFSRRLKSNWFPVTLMSSGYALAYFFIYSTYYVPGLQVLDNPYACWVLGPVLGLIGTWHGARNKNLRWFSSVFTLLVTGHASYHALTSTAVIELFGASIKVSALACVAGSIWGAALSALYKRFELAYSKDSQNFEEFANWLLNKVLHELYFVVAAANAMVLPLLLADFSQAPLFWALEAPVLLALNWRSGNIIKHVVVGLIWLASAVCLLSSAFMHEVQLAALLAVPAGGLAMGLAYRMLKSRFEHSHKVAGYCVYVYGAIAVALIAPYLHTGNIWDAMPYWMIQSLVVTGLGLALRDGFVHRAGFFAGMASLVLFGLQFQTWTWPLVAPVVLAAYALSVAYARIGVSGGWKQTEFLPFAGETVSVENAYGLERLWSWVGAATLLAASFLLMNQESVVIWWSVEALALVALGFAASRVGFRLQGLIAFGLAAAKLIVWDMSKGSLDNFNPETAFTLYRSLEFGVVGATSLAASFLYFREENRLEALAQKSDGSEETPAVEMTQSQAQAEENSQN